MEPAARPCPQCDRYRAMLVRVAPLLGDLLEISLPPEAAAECRALLRRIAEGGLPSSQNPKE